MLRIQGAILLSLVTLTTGCGRMLQYHGDGRNSPGWAAVRDNLGPTSLLINDWQKSSELGSKVGESLSTCKGLEVVATRPASEAWATNGETVDAEIIRAANEAHAQTAFVLWVSQWKYTAGPAAHGTVRYRLRVLDTRSGKELAWKNLTCRAYGRTQEEFNKTRYKALLWWSIKDSLKLPVADEPPP